LYATKLLKVLYSPRKTLQEVVQEPKYIAPLLIMILLIATNAVSAYAVLSKEYYEQILPNGTNLDEWTQNSTLWTSNVNITLSTDAINGTRYGNYSIAFSIQNSSQVWMSLTGIGTVDCSVPNGFNVSSFRTKWTSPVPTIENVTIQMFSFNSSSDYYTSDLTEAFSNSTNNIWNNITVPLATPGWVSVGQNADWGNITGLQLQFTLAVDSNATLLVDGLFFHGPFKLILQTEGAAYLLNYGVLGAFQFAVTWILLSGLIYVLIKALKGKVTWKPLLIAIGLILMTMFIGGLITAIAYSTLPTLRFPFELLGGVQGEGDASAKIISDQTYLAVQVSSIVQLVVWAWTAALAAVAVRVVAELSWAKSVMVGMVAYAATILLASFIV
jgi:hypothetical protein